MQRSYDNEFFENSFDQSDYDPDYNDYHTIVVGYNSNNNLFFNNTLIGSGFIFVIMNKDDYRELIDQTIAQNNTLNGKSVYYFTGQDFIISTFLMGINISS